MTVPGCDPVVDQRRAERLLPHAVRAGAVRRDREALRRDCPRSISSGILSDSWALGLAGQQPSTDVLTLALATPANAEPHVWGKITSVFSGLNAYYEGEGERQARLRAFGISRLSPVLERARLDARHG